MYKIYDNNDLINVRKMCNLDNTTSYCKKFGFCRYDSNCMIYSFDDRFIMVMDVGYGSSNLIF